MYITNHSKINPTKVNGKPISAEQELELQHQDIFTIGDRSFRFEYDEKYLQKHGLDDDDTVYMEKDMETSDEDYEDPEKPVAKKAKKDINLVTESQGIVQAEDKENLNTVNITTTNGNISGDNFSVRNELQVSSALKPLT